MTSPVQTRHARFDETRAVCGREGIEPGDSDQHKLPAKIAFPASLYFCSCNAASRAYVVSRGNFHQFEFTLVTVSLRDIRSETSALFSNFHERFLTAVIDGSCEVGHKNKSEAEIDDWLVGARTHQSNNYTQHCKMKLHR